MPNDDSRNQQVATEAPESESAESINTAVSDTQGIRSEPESSLESRFQNILTGHKDSSGNAQPSVGSEFVQHQIEQELHRVKPGSPVDQFLKAATPEERQKITGNLVHQSMSRSPDASEATEALGQINRLEALAKLGESIDQNDFGSKRDRYDSWLSLSRQELEPGKNGENANNILSDLFANSPIGLQSEIITARGTATIEQNLTEQFGEELIKSVLKGDDPSAYQKLKGMNVSLLKGGRSDLVSLVHVADEFQETGKEWTYDTTGSVRENLVRLADVCPSAGDVPMVRSEQSSAATGGERRIVLLPDGSYSQPARPLANLHLLEPDFRRWRDWASEQEQSTETSESEENIALAFHELIDWIEQHKKKPSFPDLTNWHPIDHHWNHDDYSKSNGLQIQGERPHWEHDQYPESDGQHYVEKTPERIELPEGSIVQAASDHHSKKYPYSKSEGLEFLESGLFSDSKVALTNTVLTDDEISEYERLESSHPKEQEEARKVTLDSGVVYDYDNAKPPHLVSITNPDNTYARFDDNGRVLECKGKDGEVRRFQYEADKLVSFSDSKGQWVLEKDAQGKETFRNTTNNQRMSDVSVTAAASTSTGEVLLAFSQHDNATGEKKTILPDGSKEIESDNGSYRLYDKDDHLLKVTNKLTGESYQFKYHPPGHPQAGKLAEVQTPKGTVWTPDEKGEVWTTSAGAKLRMQIDVDQRTGEYHYKTEHGTEEFWHPDRPAERIDGPETKATAKSLYESLNGKNGADLDKFEKLLEGKTLAQRQAIEQAYKEYTGGRPVEHDLTVRVSSESLRLKAINALKHGDDGPDYAGALTQALGKYKESYQGSDALKEIRSYLRGRSAEEMEQIRKEFPERMRMAGLKVETLDQAMESLYEADRETCKILSKGADKLNYDDYAKLSELALGSQNLDMFLETWKMAKPEFREQYAGQPDIKERVYAAFPGGMFDRVSRKGLYVDAGKAMDVLQYGYVGADKMIREACTYTFGDFETHIDMALRNMPDAERKLFIAGQKIADSNPDGKGLSPKDQLAYDRYKAIHEALHTAADGFFVGNNVHELHRWEDIAVRGGSLIAELAEKKGMLWDGTTDSVMRAIEQMTAADFERLRTDPSYRQKLEEVVRSFADGDANDQNSELGRCLALLQRKCTLEADTAAMTTTQREVYAHGKAVVHSGSLNSLTKSQQESLDVYQRFGGERANLSHRTESEKKLYEEGRQLASDIEAADFYRKQSYAASQIQGRRSIFEVIDDNNRIYGNNVPNILNALSNLRPDEKQMIGLSQSVKDGKVDLSKLSANDRRRYEQAIEFRSQLDTRLGQVLDQSMQIFASTQEKAVANTILERVGRGQSGEQGIIEKLNMYAGQMQPDKAQVAQDVQQALRNDPKLAALGKILAEAQQKNNLQKVIDGLPADQKATALQLTEAMRKAFGPALYEEYSGKLLSGTMSAADQLHLRTVGNYWDDKQGMLSDLQSLSPEDRQRLSAFLSPASMEQLLKGKTPAEAAELKRQAGKFNEVFQSLTGYEQSIFKNALREGLQPEDYLRHHMGDDLDGTDEAGIKAVFAKLTDREATRRELESKPELKGVQISERLVTMAINRKLEDVFSNYARKYGENLADALVSELGGEDLKSAWRLTRNHSDNADQSVLQEQRDFFNSLGLGSAFVDSVGYGGSTSLGKTAFDTIIQAQVRERQGLGEFDADRARELAKQLFEASREMDSAQTALSDTTIDMAINVGCVLATIPSGGTSLLALGAKIGGSTGRVLTTVGSVLQTMEKAAKLGQTAARTEFLTNWFSKASKAEQMIALGITGGAGKVGFKSAFGGDYDIATHGAADFISGFADMALNVDIPLGQWSRSAAGRTFSEITQSVAGTATHSAEHAATKIGEAALVTNYKKLLEDGLSQLSQSAIDAGGKADEKALVALAEQMVKTGVADRDKIVKQLADQMQQSLSKNVNQDLRMTQAVFEALVAARQGTLAGGVGALAYADPDASVEQNLVAVAVGAGAGGVLNLSLALPIAVAGHSARKLPPTGDAPSAGQHTDAGPTHLDPSETATRPRAELVHSAHDTESTILTETDKKLHEVSHRIEQLDRNRTRMTPDDIAREEKLIAEQKEQVREGFRQEARRHLIDRMGFSETEASAIVEDLNIDLLSYDQKTGIRGSMDPGSGHLEVRLGAGLPSDRSMTQTFLHEFEHLINHARNNSLFERDPQGAINALVDDCLTGVLNGRHRFEHVHAAQSAADHVRPRLSAEKFSQNEIDFVKQQLKEYLTQQSTQGELGSVVTAQELKDWMASKVPPATFPNSTNEKVLLDEMVGEIQHAHQVFESSKLTDDALKDPAVAKLKEALKTKYGISAAELHHHFSGISDSTLGVGITEIYKYSSPEEMAANRLPLYRLYAESGAKLRTEITAILNSSATANLPTESKAVLKELKSFSEQLDQKKAEIDKERVRVQEELKDKPGELKAKLKQLDAEERKAIRKLEKQIVDKLGSPEGQGLLGDMLDSRQPKLQDHAEALSQTYDGRFEIVQRLRDLTNTEMLSRAMRELDSARQSGDAMRLAEATNKLDEATDNLIKFSSDKLLLDAVALLDGRGILRLEHMLREAPPNKLANLIDALNRNGVPAKTILDALGPEKSLDAILPLIASSRDTHLLHTMIFESSPEVKARLAAILKNSHEARRAIDMQIPYLLEQADKSGNLVDAVNFLSSDAGMSRTAIIDNLGPKMEASVNAIFDAPKVRYEPAKQREAFEPISLADLPEPALVANSTTMVELTTALSQLKTRWQSEGLPNKLEVLQMKKAINENIEMPEVKQFLDLVGKHKLDEAGKVADALPDALRQPLQQLLKIERFSDELKDTIDPILSKMGLPPIKIEHLSRDTAGMAYRAGTTDLLMRPETLSTFLDIKDTAFIPAILHELTHLDQNVLVMRSIYEQLSSNGPVTAASLKAEFEKLTGVKASKTADTLADFVIDAKLPPLTSDQIKRANALTQSLSTFFEAGQDLRRVRELSSKAEKLLTENKIPEAESQLLSDFVASAQNDDWVEAVQKDPSASPTLLAMIELARTSPQQIDSANLSKEIVKWKNAAFRQEQTVYTYSVHERESNEVMTQAQTIVEAAERKHRQPEVAAKQQAGVQFAGSMLERHMMEETFERISKTLADSNWNSLSNEQKRQIMEDALSKFFLDKYKEDPKSLVASQLHSLSRRIKFEPTTGNSPEFIFRQDPNDKIATQFCVKVPDNALQSPEQAMIIIAKAYAGISAVNQHAPLSTLRTHSYTLDGDPEAMKQLLRVHPNLETLRSRIAAMAPIVETVAMHRFKANGQK